VVARFMRWKTLDRRYGPVRPKRECPGSEQTNLMNGPGAVLPPPEQRHSYHRGVTLSRTAKIVLSLSVVVAALAFLVVVDLGVNAGRIHYGVRLDHLNLGGLTELEAVDVLDRRGSAMVQAPVVFRRDGVRCVFLPLDVGWSPRVHRAVAEALAVGRDGSSFHAARQRLQAWFGGVRIRWPNPTNRHQVAAVLDRCQKLATASGLQISRWKMRLKIKVALATWPRRTPIRLVASPGQWGSATGSVPRSDWEMEKSRWLRKAPA
jgi:hypothetical protein